MSKRDLVQDLKRAEKTISDLRKEVMELRLKNGRLTGSLAETKEWLRKYYDKWKATPDWLQKEMDNKSNKKDERTTILNSGTNRGQDDIEPGGTFEAGD